MGPSNGERASVRKKESTGEGEAEAESEAEEGRYIDGVQQAEDTSRGSRVKLAYQI